MYKGILTVTEKQVQDKLHFIHESCQIDDHKEVGSMKLPVRLEHQIRLCINALEEMVTVKGYDLTNPDVVKKSMELDRYIIRAMRLQEQHRSNEKQPVNT